METGNSTAWFLKTSVGQGVGFVRSVLGAIEGGTLVTETPKVAAS